MSKKEEITDMMTDKAFRDLKVGHLLKFKSATIKITKIDRKNKRMWGEHVVTHNHQTIVSHVGHNVDSTPETIQEFGAPYCEDCEEPVTIPSTEDGDKKALDRRDDEERNVLTDGTRVG